MCVYINIHTHIYRVYEKFMVKASLKFFNFTRTHFDSTIKKCKMRAEEIKSTISTYQTVISSWQPHIFLQVISILIKVWVS